MSDPRPVIFLDCDTGVDDAMALFYLLASDIDFVGVGTVSGNIDAEQAARNTLDLLALAGRSEVPVFLGAHDHLTHAYDGAVPHIHGANGIGNVTVPRAEGEIQSESAAEAIVRLSHEHAGELHLVPIGPLTNIALALQLDPTLPSRIKHVTLMGGAAMVPGNLSPVAEANIGNDPEAAAAVFAADWPLTIVPLDVTLDHALEESDRQTLIESGRPVATVMADILELYFDFYITVYGTARCALHDPLAAAIAVGDVKPSVAPIVHAVVDTTDGPSRGQTVCDLRGRFLGYPAQEGAHTRVVLELDDDFAPLLTRTLLSI